VFVLTGCKAAECGAAAGGDLLRLRKVVVKYADGSPSEKEVFFIIGFIGVSLVVVRREKRLSSGANELKCGS
jgi:hypothetical protein